MRLIIDSIAQTPELRKRWRARVQQAILGHLLWQHIEFSGSCPITEPPFLDVYLARPNRVDNPFWLRYNHFEGLLDIGYGQWGGRSHQVVARDWLDLYCRWRSLPRLT